MTSGPITGPLILYILPLLGSGIFQQLYNTVDFIFIGNILNKTAAAAVGASSTLIYCTIGLFLGISVGTSVVISQAFGANDAAKADKALHTSVAIGLIGGVALSTVLIIISLRRKDGVLYLKLSNITLDLSILKSILRIGLPTGIQTLLITVSNIAVQYYVNGFGEVAIAAFLWIMRKEAARS